MGIDEAGYGPLLGPLVISAASVRLGDDKLKADLWEILSNSVAKRKKGLAGRLLITDSKKAYSRNSGTRHLSRTVLASFGCLGKKPESLGQLLMELCPECAGRLRSYDWYEGVDKVELGHNKEDIELAGAVLKKDMVNNGMDIASMSSFCLDVGHFNEMVGVVKNKASVSFTYICRLIQEAFEKFGKNNLQIVIDRQGGRTYYRKVLQRMFEELELAVVREDEKLSSYELAGGDKKMRIHFVVGADEKYLPVSLASMVSKYLRELLMERVNEHFLRHKADIKPTAGYYTDGKRFVKDIDSHLPKIEYDKTMLIRQK